MSDRTAHDIAAPPALLAARGPGSFELGLTVECDLSDDDLVALSAYAVVARQLATDAPDQTRLAGDRATAIDLAWRTNVRYRVDERGDRWLDGAVGPLAHLGWLAEAAVTPDPLTRHNRRPQTTDTRPEDPTCP